MFTFFCSYNVGCTKRMGLFPNRKTTLENMKKQRALNGNHKHCSLETKKKVRLSTAFDFYAGYYVCFCDSIPFVDVKDNCPLQHKKTYTLRNQCLLYQTYSSYLFPTSHYVRGKYNWSPMFSSWLSVWHKCCIKPLWLCQTAPSVQKPVAAALSTGHSVYPAQGESSQCSDLSGYKRPLSPLSATQRVSAGQDSELPLLPYSLLPSDPGQWNIEAVYEFISSLPGGRCLNS